MTTNLPKGIVTNATSIQRDISDIERVAIEDLIRLWRGMLPFKPKLTIVYTTNKDVLKNDTGRRLENLFWRILGSDRIRETITGHTVAAIFTRITDASSLIRPISSPQLRQTNPLTPPKGIYKKKGKEALVAPPTKEEPKRALPPILKSSKRDLVAYGKKAEHIRINTENIDTEKKDEVKQKKRTSFVAGTRRKRPAPPRRKSSSQTQTPTTPTGRNEEESEGSTSSSSLTDIPQRTRPPISRSTSNLRQTTNSDLDSESITETRLPRTKSQVDWKVPTYPIPTPSSRTPILSTRNNGLPPSKPGQAVPRVDSAKDVRWERPDSGWLVDQDFRSKFAERRLSGAANLSNQPGGPSDESSSESSSEEEPEEEIRDKPLTRSESQLTLILARDRAERARLEASRAKKAKA